MNDQPKTLDETLPKEVRDAIDEIGPLAKREQELLHELGPIQKRIAELNAIVRNWMNS